MVFFRKESDMSLMDNVIRKAGEYIGVSEDPPESNNVSFNTNYYGQEVYDNSARSYPWCVTFLWDIFRMSGASHVFCDGMKTASTETVYSHYKDKNMLFDSGKKGDIILILSNGAGQSRRVNHAGLVVAVNKDGSYETIEGNTGSTDIANGGMVMKMTRNFDGRGYTIVGFARPDYDSKGPKPGPGNNQNQGNKPGPGSGPNQSYKPAANEIPITANLTIVGSGVRIRTAPNTSAGVVKNLSVGEVVKASGRIASRYNPWFHISEGFISGNYVRGWIKDYNDNRRWWYVDKDYKYAKAEWKNIGGKDYCFGKDSYLFVSCYIKSAVSGVYYWVDDNGVYQKQYDTTSPSRKYRVVENYKTENAYRN